MFENIPGQFILIIVAMVIGGIQWLVERIRKNARGEDDSSARSELEDLYEDAREEISERQAKQYPTEQELQARFGGQQIRTITPAIPPAIPGAPTPPPIPGALPPRRTPSRPVLSKAEQDALKRLQARQAKGGARSARRSRSQSRVRELLATPSSARDAIVLSEILGPPKGAA
jgi:hypothetical protein